MICNLIGVVLTCIHTGSGVTTIYNRTPEAAPTTQVRMTPQEWQSIYTSVGWQTDKQYFCRGIVHTMDRKMCK